MEALGAGFVITIFLLYALFVISAIVIGIGGTIIWILALIDAATNEPSEGNDKLIWLLVIILTHWIGALIYYFVRRPQRIKQFGK